jgi:hypothetical protein
VPFDYKYQDNKLPVTYKILLKKEIMDQNSKDDEQDRPHAKRSKSPRLQKESISEKSLAYLERESQEID